MEFFYVVISRFLYSNSFILATVKIKNNNLTDFPSKGINNLTSNYMNETFKIKSTGFDEIKKQSIKRAVPILLVSMIFGIAIPFFNSENKEDVWYVLPFILPIMLFALGSGINKGLKRQKMLFESYQLIFSENNIVREQLNTPIVNIQINEIKSIVKRQKRRL